MNLKEGRSRTTANLDAMSTLQLHFRTTLSGFQNILRPIQLKFCGAKKKKKKKWNLRTSVYTEYVVILWRVIRRGVSYSCAQNLKILRAEILSVTMEEQSLHPVWSIITWSLCSRWLADTLPRFWLVAMQVRTRTTHTHTHTQQTPLNPSVFQSISIPPPLYTYHFFIVFL